MSSRYKISTETPFHFITTTTVWWTAIFTSKLTCGVLTESLSYCREHKGLEVFAYVIMPTHLHAIVSTKGDHSLSNVMRDFKRYTSKKLVHVLETSGWELPLRAFKKAAQIAGKGNDYKVWERDFHPQSILDEEMFRQKAEYIHNNPVRKGLVRVPADWVYSSAGFFDLGEEGPFSLDSIE